MTERPGKRRFPVTGDVQWLRDHKIGAIVVVLLLVVVIWTVLEMDSGREEAGLSACEDAVQEKLIGDYDPAIFVTLVGKSNNTDFEYNAVADDGDGQWWCSIRWSDDQPDVTVHNGLLETD